MTMSEEQSRERGSELRQLFCDWDPIGVRQTTEYFGLKGNVSNCAEPPARLKAWFPRAPSTS